jgi:hypothetical protein
VSYLNLECLRVAIDGDIAPLPDWAISAIEIGAWARYASVSIDTRLVVCCVVPCRAVFTALVGLGAVASGGTLFRKGFTWPDLMNLSPGTEIFWTEKGKKQKFAGIVGPHEIIGEQTMVPVTVTKGPVKKIGRWLFSETKFRECIFSEEKLPSSTASDQFARAGHFYSALGIPSDSSWLMTAGAEVRFVANRAALKRSLEGWELTSDTAKNLSSVDQLLILRDEGDPALAKARISHLRGSIISNSPVSVVDGPLAFQRIPDIEAGSIVVVLERAELAEEHLDLLIQARNEHSFECELEAAELVPSNIPTTVEITGYCLRSS